MNRPHSKTHQVLCGDRLSRAASPHHHARQSVSHVLQAVCQSQDGHDLAGHCNVEPGLGCEKRKKKNIIHNVNHKGNRANFFMQWPLQLADIKIPILQTMKEINRKFVVAWLLVCEIMNSNMFTLALQKLFWEWVSNPPDHCAVVITPCGKKTKKLATFHSHRLYHMGQRIQVLWTCSSFGVMTLRKKLNNEDV